MQWLRHAVFPAVPRVVYFRALAEVKIRAMVAAVAGLARVRAMAAPVTVALEVQVIVEEEITNKYYATYAHYACSCGSSHRGRRWHLLYLLRTSPQYRLLRHHVERRRSDAER